MKEITKEIKQNNRKTDVPSHYFEIKKAISELTLFTSKQQIFLGNYKEHKLIISLYETPPTQHELEYIPQEILDELDSYIENVMNSKTCKVLKYTIQNRIYIMKIRLFNGSQKEIVIFIDELSKKYDIDNLLEIQDNYKIVINNIHEGVLITRNYKILSMNNQTLQIFGYDFSDLFERNITDFVCKEDKDKLIETCINYTGDKNITSSHEFRIIAKNGDIKWLSCNLIQFKLDNQILILSFIRDISKEKEDLFKMKRLSHMVQASNAALVLIDENACVVYANPASFVICKNTEETYKNVLGKNVLKFIEESDRSKLLVEAKDEVDTFGIWKGQINLIAKDKSIIPTEMICSKLITDTGKTYYLANYVDVSEKKEMEKKLKDSELKYRTLFNSSMDAILLLYNETFVDCNESALKLFNCTKDYLIGKTPIDVSANIENISILAKEKMRLVMDGYPQRFEWLHVKLPDEEMCTEVSLTLAEINNKKYIQAIIRDISERKLHESELKEKNKTIKTLAAQQSLLLNNLDVHVWYLVNPFTYGFVNQAHSQFFGFTPEEMSNKNMKQVFLHRMLEFEVMENEQLFKIGEPIEVDRWVKDKNNIDRMLRIKKIPKKADDGSVEFIVCWCYDITDEYMKSVESENQRALMEKRILDFFDETEIKMNEKYTAINDRLAEAASKLPLFLKSQTNL